MLQFDKTDNRSLRNIVTTSALALATLASSPALAGKFLVSCSEGNPESFSPQVTATGTSMSAALPLFLRCKVFDGHGAVRKQVKGHRIDPFLQVFTGVDIVND